MNTSDIKILLVDDEPDILEIVGYNLKSQGYAVKTASNGLEAIETGKTFKPHLIILDVMMPEMDGIEACERLRKLPELNHSIITFLTARGEDYSQVAGFDAGADDYVTKPVKPRIFISKVKAMLGRALAPALVGSLHVAALLGRRAVRAAWYTQALAPVAAVCGRTPCNNSMNEA